MAAHASPIGPEYLDPGRFESSYGQEWFVRRGPAGLLEEVAPNGCGSARASGSEPVLPMGL
jgi:hypothetical protein